MKKKKNSKLWSSEVIVGSWSLLKIKRELCLLKTPQHFIGPSRKWGQSELDTCLLGILSWPWLSSHDFTGSCWIGTRSLTRNHVNKFGINLHIGKGWTFLEISYELYMQSRESHINTVNLNLSCTSFNFTLYIPMSQISFHQIEKPKDIPVFRVILLLFIFLYCMNVRTWLK